MFKAIDRFLKRLLTRKQPKQADRLNVIPGKMKCEHVSVTRFVDADGKPNGIVERNNLCSVSQFTPVGDWGEPERHPHPSPRFARLKVRRQRAVAFSVCGACGAVDVVFGYNQKDA